MEDEEELQVRDKFALYEKQLQEGLCPKGCGPLTIIDANERKCCECGYRHVSTNVPFYARKPHVDLD